MLPGLHADTATVRVNTMYHGLWHGLNPRVNALLLSCSRHIDVSSQRGNEAEIGAALSEVFSDWLVNRPDVWITGKVWPAAAAAADNSGKCPSPAEVRAQAKAVLAALKVDYLDLYLLPTHDDAAAFKVLL